MIFQLKMVTSVDFHIRILTHTKPCVASTKHRWPQFDLQIHENSFFD